MLSLEITILLKKNGTHDTIENWMAYIRNLWSECIQMEQDMLKEEKLEFERLNTLKSLAKENLETEKK